MSSNPPASIPPPPDGLSPSVVEEIIRQSAQQLEVKRRELELQQQNQANQYEYAKAALAAQSEDLKDTRKHDASQLTRRLVFSAFLVLVTVAFLGFCIQAGKERFAEEALNCFSMAEAGQSAAVRMPRLAVETARPSPAIATMRRRSHRPYSVSTTVVFSGASSITRDTGATSPRSSSKKFQSKRPSSLRGSSR